MTTYDLIMKTADYIEQNPQKFDFYAHDPRDWKNGIGCALGHMGAIAGTETHGLRRISIQLLGIESDEFYRRMGYEYTEYVRNPALSLTGRPTRIYEWASTAAKCAKRLREYAHEYHEPAAPAGLPESVREIFETTTECA